jgi:CheY-like chemotaxis protein
MKNRGVLTETATAIQPSPIHWHVIDHFAARYLCLFRRVVKRFLGTRVHSRKASRLMSDFHMKNDHQILIVDDDEEDHLILLDYFREKGIADKVWFVENGQQALTYFTSVTELSDLPRLVVLDMQMPVLDGVQTLAEMKQLPRLKEIPVIILSTSENDFERNKALSLGALDYLAKPVTLQEGKDMVERFARFLDS